MPRHYTRAPLADRFWPKVDRRGPDECWPWLAGTAHFGHGRIVVMLDVGRFTTAQAHRVAWELTNGPIPAGLCVLHACDNPPCCNPAHLWLGTQLENVRDRHAKRRDASGLQSRHYTHPESTPRGEQNGNSKLTEGAVRDIRARYTAGGISQQALAVEYHVSQQVVSWVVRRKTWAHVL